MTKIDYCDKLWPVVTGCKPGGCGAGCLRCWARRNAAGRLKHRRHYEGLTMPNGDWTGEIRENADILEDPYHWRKPQCVAVAFTGDLFRASWEFIRSVFVVMSRCSQHTFLVLTKCAGAMRETCERFMKLHAKLGWPRGARLDNVLFGVSVWDQASADTMLPELLKCPGKLWISAEPLLGPIDFRKLASPGPDCPRLRGIVVGGESGPGARPCHPEWVRGILADCAFLETRFAFKQWGAWRPEGESVGPIALSGNHKRVSVIGIDGQRGNAENGPYALMANVGKKAAGRMLDGGTWEDWPCR
jgi:protein gp37